MNKPLIGLTSYSRTEDDRFTIPASYLDAVERAEGIPVILTPTNTNIQAMAESLDGFVLTGGADVCPSEYLGEHHESVYGVNKERDAFELNLSRAIVEANKPVLAICRGIQVLNVALGGTLVEDIPTTYGDSIAHRSDNFSKVEHWVKIDPDSALSEICGLTEFNCPSFHHQSVREIAPEFKAVAWSDDGVIEAIESEKHPGVIAVQWHPEYVADADESQQKIFNVLVRNALN